MAGLSGARAIGHIVHASIARPTPPIVGGDVEASATMTEGVPLRRRYVDLFYFVYFAFHLFASLCVDSA